MVPASFKSSGYCQSSNSTSSKYCTLSMNLHHVGFTIIFLTINMYSEYKVRLLVCNVDMMNVCRNPQR